MNKIVFSILKGLLISSLPLLLSGSSGTSSSLLELLLTPLGLVGLIALIAVLGLVGLAWKLADSVQNKKKPR